MVTLAWEPGESLESLGDFGKESLENESLESLGDFGKESLENH